MQYHHAPLTLVCMYCAMNAAWADEPTTIALPAMQSLGKSVDAPLLIIAPAAVKKNVAMPSNITLDLHAGRIDGMVLEYPPEVPLKAVADAVARAEKGSRHLAKLTPFGIWMWVNDENKYTIQVRAIGGGEDGVGMTLINHKRGRPWADEVEDIVDKLLKEAHDDRVKGVDDKGSP